MLPRLKQTILRHPYLLFVLMAPIFLLISVFTRNRIVDIHTHDTMYVVSVAYIIWFLIILLSIGWTLYHLLEKVLLSKHLTWFHVISTIAFFIFCIVIALRSDGTPPTGYNWRITHDQMQTEQIIDTIAVLLFIAGQICLLVNLVGGLIKGRNH